MSQENILNFPFVVLFHENMNDCILYPYPLIFKCPSKAMTILTMNQHAQHQDPETDATKQNTAIIQFIIFTTLFLLLSERFTMFCFV